MHIFLFGQVSLCLRPADVLLVTYNHMDAIRNFACDNPAISNQVENVYKLLYEVTVVIKILCNMIMQHKSLLVIGY